MKERPILFSAPMVRALLNCTKSQTRREVKQSLERLGDGDFYAFDHKGINYRVNARHATVAAWAHLLQFCPYGQPGDRLWVRETHHVASAGNMDGTGMVVFYKATDPDCPYGWTPSIHMPRWASRILLEIVSVRVERLQDISVQDAIAEGCASGERDPVVDYLHLWESINGRGSWAANPWVWVVEFKRVDQ